MICPCIAMPAAEREHRDLAERRASRPAWRPAAAVSRTVRIRSPNSCRAALSSRPISRSSWPKPLTTRTPVTVSSTCWARSAARCWADQVPGTAPAGCAPPRHATTGATTSAIRVSSGDSHSIAAERGDREHHRADRQRHHEQQALHQLQVGDRAGHDLAGAQRVLLGAVEPLHRAEHLLAQVVLHVEGEPAAEVAAQERGAERGQLHHHQRGDQPAEPARSCPAIASSTTNLTSSGPAAWKPTPTTAETSDSTHQPAVLPARAPQPADPAARGSSTRSRLRTPTDSSGRDSGPP